MTPPKCENCGNDMEPGTFKEWTCYHCFCYIDNEAPDDEKDSKEMNANLEIRKIKKPLTCGYAFPRVHESFVGKHITDFYAVDYPCCFCVYNDETCSMCGECNNYLCFVDKATDAVISELEAIRNRDIRPSDPLCVKDKLFHEEKISNDDELEKKIDLACHFRGNQSPPPEPEQSEENKIVGKMVETFAATFDEDLSSVVCSFEGLPAATPEPDLSEENKQYRTGSIVYRKKDELDALVSAHWNYIKSLLNVSADRDRLFTFDEVMAMREWDYTSSAKHFYGHGFEDGVNGGTDEP